MKVLYSWLKEYVDIDLQPKELETKLFSVGFEVEGMDYLGENLEKVVVGQITSIPSTSKPTENSFVSSSFG